ncbi:MAG: hypothetical protein ABSH05_19305 [Bryobacteraceae bacterium]|jgi:hypothetical protein
MKPLPETGPELHAIQRGRSGWKLSQPGCQKACIPVHYWHPN